MYQLYIANKNYSSWSLRPWVLMRELGIEFEERLRHFEAEDNFHRFRQFSPSGKVPCLVDGDCPVWDSLAIVEYLAERHDGVWPAAGQARTFARCAAAEMHSSFQTLREVCPMNCSIKVELTEISPALQKDVERIDELWCEGLKRFGGDFLSGEAFTAVDAFFCPVACRFNSFDLPLSAPARAYCERLLSTRAMVEWYEAAIREPWIEQSAEDGMRAIGRVISDARSGL